MSRIIKTEWGTWIDLDMVIAVAPCTYHNVPDIGEDFSIQFKFIDEPMVMSSSDSYFAGDVVKLRAARERFVQLCRNKKPIELGPLNEPLERLSQLRTDMLTVGKSAATIHGSAALNWSWMIDLSVQKIMKELRKRQWESDVTTDKTVFSENVDASP